MTLDPRNSLLQLSQALTHSVAPAHHNREQVQRNNHYPTNSCNRYRIHEQLPFSSPTTIACASAEIVIVVPPVVEPPRAPFRARELAVCLVLGGWTGVGAYCYGHSSG